MNEKSFVPGPAPEMMVEDALCFVFVGRQMLLRAGGDASFKVPRPADLMGLRVGPANRT